MGNHIFFSFILLVMKFRIEVKIENTTTNQMAIEGIEKYSKRNKSALSRTINAKIISNIP